MDCQTQFASVKDAADAILGAPFKLRGSGPKEFYCLGLIVFMLREVFGVRIEDPLTCSSVSRGARKLANMLRPIRPDERPDEGDIVHFERLPDGLQHFAMVEDRLWVVEACQAVGVRRRRLHEALKDSCTVYRLIDKPLR